MKGKKKAAAILLALAVVAAGLLAVWIWNSQPVMCRIAQYEDTTGLQGMFYTMETDQGLIVIDGGNAGNADYVRAVIEEKGGHVSAWILTHPHPDHIGAFNMLWDELQEEIDVIYAPEIDYLTYQERAHEWDGFEGYDVFLNYMSESDKLQLLHTGDRFRLCGLRFEILHACEDYVYEHSNDIGNDCGLMIRVSNRKESMLFCADVGVGMSEKIMEQYSKKIKCDYIQMGHHGNGGLSEAFYRLASPRAAFFDAPDWLMNPEEGKNYSTPANRQLMESLGAQIFDYSTAPNIVELK